MSSVVGTVGTSPHAFLSDTGGKPSRDTPSFTPSTRGLLSGLSAIFVYAGTPAPGAFPCSAASALLLASPALLTATRCFRLLMCRLRDAHHSVIRRCCWNSRSGATGHHGSRLVIFRLLSRYRLDPVPNAAPPNLHTPRRAVVALGVQIIRVSAGSIGACSSRLNTPQRIVEPPRVHSSPPGGGTPLMTRAVVFFRLALSRHHWSCGHPLPGDRCFPY